MSQEFPRTPEEREEGIEVDLRRFFPEAREQFAFLELDGQNPSLAHLFNEDLPNGVERFRLVSDFVADDRTLGSVMHGLLDGLAPAIHGTLDGIERLGKQRSVFIGAINTSYGDIAEQHSNLLASNMNVLADCLETGDTFAIRGARLTLLQPHQTEQIVNETLLSYAQDQRPLRELFDKADLPLPSILRSMRRGSEKAAREQLWNYLTRRNTQDLTADEFGRLRKTTIESLFKEVTVRFSDSLGEDTDQTRYISIDEAPEEFAQPIYTSRANIQETGPIRVSYRTTFDRHLVKPLISWDRHPDGARSFVFETFQTKSVPGEAYIDHFSIDSLFGAIFIAFLERPERGWKLDELSYKKAQSDYAGALASLVVLANEETLVKSLSGIEFLASLD